MRPPEPESPKSCKVKIPSEPKEAAMVDDDLESVEDYVEKVIFVKTKKVGYLIGTAGRTIWGFENNSGAKIDILSPNSRDNETPILLSGTSESVRNVMRMIIDLYHMNNYSSRLWQHLRNTPADEENGGKIFGHEEILVPARHVVQMAKFAPIVEVKTGVHMEIGRERDDDPGRVPFGFIGTAEQNSNAESVIVEKLAEIESSAAEVTTAADSSVSDDDSDKNSPPPTRRCSWRRNRNRNKRKKQRHLAKQQKSWAASGKCSTASADRMTSTLMSMQNYSETVTVAGENVDHTVLQPICRANDVVMEIVSNNNVSAGGAKVKTDVVISGHECVSLVCDPRRAATSPAAAAGPGVCAPELPRLVLAR